MSGTWRCTTAPPTACSASVTRTGGLSRGSWINGKSQTPNPKPQTPNPNARHGDVWIWVLGFGFWNLAKALVYIELHGASAFSFLRGASLPKTLVERAAALGYPALALLDADGVYGAPRFHKAAQQAGLRAIIGAELTIEAGAIGAGKAGKAGWAGEGGGAGRGGCAGPGNVAITRARRLARRLQRPLPPGHAHEDACPERRGGARARRARGMHERPGGPGRPAGARGAALRCRRVARSPRRPVRPRRCLRRAPASSAARRRVRSRGAHRTGQGVSGAGDRYQWRPLCRAGRSPAVRCADLRASPD